MTNKQTTNAMNGAELLIQSLMDNDVEVVFGYPGGAVLPLFDALYRVNPSFKNILCRHEQGLIHAAEGYARTTGKPGVVIATSGPGVTNLLTGIADALLDSLPIVVIAGQVTSALIGTDGFQEADVIGLTTPITKYNYQVKDVKDLPRILNEAFHIASTGRPGPVLVDIPKNIFETEVDTAVCGNMNLPGYQPTKHPHPAQIKRVLSALEQAKRPVLLVGAGIITSGASDVLAEFIKSYPMPVVNTLQGTGAFDQHHELSMGMAGMHGSYGANMAIEKSDLLINIGSRFDDRLTGSIATFAPDAVIAHIDIDPAEIGKNVPTNIPVVADAKAALEAMMELEEQELDFSEWNEECIQTNEAHPFWYKTGQELISPQWFTEKVAEKTNHEAIVITDVGQHQMWAAQFSNVRQPNHFVTSGGLGTMGFGVPAAIGAQVGHPDKVVTLFVGDGGFQMTNQELMVMKEHNLPIKMFIINNEALGMVRQWQEILYDENYSESLMTGRNPDFIKMAESYGVKAYKVDKESEVDQVLDEVFAHDGPVLVDVRVEREEKVYPMVPAGASYSEMIGVDNPCKE